MRNKNRKKKLSAPERKLLKVVGQDIGRIIKQRGETESEVSLRAKVARSTIREVREGKSNVGLVTFQRILNAIECGSVANYLAKFTPLGT